MSQYLKELQNLSFSTLTKNVDWQKMLIDKTNNVNTFKYKLLCQPYKRDVYWKNLTKIGNCPPLLLNFTISIRLSVIVYVLFVCDVIDNSIVLTNYNFKMVELHSQAKIPIFKTCVFYNTKYPIPISFMFVFET